MPHTSADSNPRYRGDLQGLRAIAILLVVLAHAGVPQIAGGFVGVDIFFVLSGYLITGLLLREIEQDGRIYFARFYARRMKRLLPAMIVMLCTVFSMAFGLLSEVEAYAQLASAPAAVAISFQPLTENPQRLGRPITLELCCLDLLDRKQPAIRVLHDAFANLAICARRRNPYRLCTYLITSAL